MELHVCAPEVIEVRALRFKCPNCKPFTVAAVGFLQEWYGWSVTCLRCGEAFQDGEWLPRPAERGWRAKNIAAARARYRRHKPKP